MSGININLQTPTPPISVEQESKILTDIQRYCTMWSTIANAYNVCIVILGVAAISTSVLVSIYTGTNIDVISIKTLKVLACISTISLGLMTAFNLVSNSNNARNAWRSLNSAMMMYKSGTISIQQLIEQYQKGEGQVGNITFNYGANSNDKNGTFTHDIANADILKKGQTIDAEVVGLNGDDKANDLQKTKEIKSGNTIDNPEKKQPLAYIKDQNVDIPKVQIDIKGELPETAK